MRISVVAIGLESKTRQTPRWQRQASLLASTAAKNRLWPARHKCVSRVAQTGRIGLFLGQVQG